MVSLKLIVNSLFFSTRWSGYMYETLGVWYSINTGGETLNLVYL